MKVAYIVIEALLLLTASSAKTPAKSKRPPKLQAAPVKNPMSNPNSCKGHCTEYAGNCYCDEDCEDYGDCCNDFCEECPILCDSGDFSCKGNCGGQSDGSPGAEGCLCSNDDCTGSWPDPNCCSDYQEWCGVISHYSCEGRCGGMAPGGCWCDACCDNRNDCCADSCDECGHEC